MSLIRSALRTAGEVASRTFDDGFIHAGNLAYLSLTSLFPIFVVIAVVAGAVGRTESGLEALGFFFQQVPPAVADALRGPVADLVSRQGQSLLTLGAVVGLWSAASFVDTIRDIIRRAYGVSGGAVWREKLMTFVGVIVAVLVLLISLVLQVALVAAQQFIENIVPQFTAVIGVLNLGKLAPALTMFLALHVLFTALTPPRYRQNAREWPGALLTTIVWIGATTLLPQVLSLLADYRATYGGLAGVMISLLFFYVVGLGLVTGAHLNAVLAGARPMHELETGNERTDGGQARAHHGARQ